MIDTSYVRTMARYGAWQNESVCIAAGRLSDDERHLDRGAFFGSITGTLNHLLWGDRIWMNRFAETKPPKMPSIPESVHETESWTAYQRARSEMDQAISSWASDLDSTWFDGNLSWFSGAAKRDVTKPKDILVIHFFNHATHHRGQVHAMLTTAGVNPADTDLFLMPE